MSLYTLVQGTVGQTGRTEVSNGNQSESEIIRVAFSKLHPKKPKNFDKLVPFCQEKGLEKVSECALSKGE